MDIKEITEVEEKKRVTRLILESLPEWFGIAEAREEYISESAECRCFAAYDGQQPIGMLCLKETGKDTMELHVLGVKKEYHRKCLGKELFAKADSAKPKLSVEPEDAMSICNEEAFLKWKDAEYLVGSAMEENNLVREDVLNLDDKKLANEGFEHYVLEDRSRFGIGIRRNAKGYENSVIVNWMTGADFDLTSPTNCGLILDNTDGKWTDQKIVWLICQYNYSHINFSKLPYPYDKYKALSGTQKGWLFTGIFTVVVVVTFGDIFWRLRKK